jgi:hypothetical protein
MAKFNKRKGDTDKGLVWHDPATNTADSLHALLYDFDIDDWELKENQKAWLLKAISFMASDVEARKKSGKLIYKKAVWKIYINGYASRTGDFAHNVELSAHRAQAVQKFLDQYMDKRIGPDEIQKDFIPNGFAKTTLKGENPLGRSVNVLIQRPGLVIPQITLPVPDGPVGSTRFAVRLLGDITIAKYLTKEVAFFQFVDIALKTMAFFTFARSLGVSVPLPGPPVSMTKGGKFTSFETTKLVDLKDFEGEATFGQGPGIGPYSLVDALLSIDTFAFLKKGVSIKMPHTKGIKIDTGFQFGMSIFSSTDGILKWEPKEVYPYTGLPIP